MRAQPQLHSPGGRCQIQRLPRPSSTWRPPEALDSNSHQPQPVWPVIREDKQFLVFFFKRLKLNQSGRYEAAFPYLSPCGREQNFVRCDDRPIVFTHLLQGASGEELLSYCGGADKLAVPFQPEKLLMLPENGRLYHPGPEKAGGVGLVKSALAFELSPCFDYEQGPSQAPTHFRWRDRRHALTNELLPFIRDKKDEGT
nr:UPF0598 protein C8orf82-like [Zootoca vivipara]